MSDYSNSQSLSDFLSQLKHVQWFENIGKPIDSGAEAQRIFSWEDWPGPESPSVDQLNSRQQSFYDEILSTAGDKSEQIKELWKRIHAIVVQDAACNVPYDDKQDAWYGPTTAVWHAASMAGLIGLYTFLNRPVPSDLQEQWKWFVEGHWPCGQTQEKKLIIY